MHWQIWLFVANFFHIFMHLSNIFLVWVNIGNAEKKYSQFHKISKVSIENK